MSRRALIWLAMLVGTAACAAIIWNDPTIVEGGMNADMLWPASFVWDLTTRSDGWRGHSLSRLPSLFPDVVTWASLWLVVGSVRWTALLYGALQLFGSVAVVGWIAARIAGRTWTVGAAAVFAVTAGLIGLALGGFGAGGFIRTIVLPIIHVGPMLIGLFGAARAARRLRIGGSAWEVGAVSACVFLSDRLLLVEFLLPLLVATGVLAASGRVALSRAGGLIVWAAAGAALGAVALRQLKHAGVQADAMPRISGPMIAAALHRVMATIPDLIGQAPAVLSVIGLAVVSFAAVGVWLFAPARRTRATRGDAEQSFLWLFIGVAATGSVAFTACFYDDLGSMRYLAGLWCCVVVALGAGLARVPGAGAAAGPVAALTLAVLLAVIARDGGRIALLDWDYDVAACLRQDRGRLGLHAGLAEYWVARPTTVALGWSSQIDQITNDGYANPWNSDARWFRESFADPRRPPDYDFVVMRRLLPDRIEAHFGHPDLIVPCSDTALWVYRGRSLEPEVTQWLAPTGGRR